MSQSKVRALILDVERDRVLDLCVGADDRGDCPRAHTGDVVPCAGHLLVAEADTVHWRLALQVGDFATKCPLRGFATGSPGAPATPGEGHPGRARQQPPER